MERRFVSLAVIAMASCSLFTDLSGLSTGSLAPLPDASIDAAGDATSDAGTDATTARSFCELRDAAMCTDFDRGTIEELGFVRDVGGSGALRIDEGSAVSPPRSLLATAPDLPDPGTHYARVCRGLSSPVTGPPAVAVEFDVMVAKSTWGDGNVALFELFYNKLGETIFLHDEDLTITTAKPDLVYTASSKKLLGDRWAHLRLEATFAPGSGTVSLQLDGSIIAERTGIPFPNITANSINVCMGIARYNAPTPPLTIRYDNALVEIR